KQRWWRKLIPKRKPKTLEAGARPRQAGGKSPRGFSLGETLKPLRPILAPPPVLRAILYCARAPPLTSVNNHISSAKHTVEGWITPQFDIVRGNVTTASGQTRGHPATAAFDNFKNTYWEATNATPTVTLRFESPVNIDKIVVRNGASDN